MVHGQRRRECGGPLWSLARALSRAQADDEERKLLGTQIKVCFSPRQGSTMPLEVAFGLVPSDDLTNITIRRTKVSGCVGSVADCSMCQGDCMHYIEAYEKFIQPGITSCLG